MSAVYFDYNATTPVHGDILPKISKFAKEFGNPSSLHRYGRASQNILETARMEILDDFKGYKLVFTSSGTEANHSAFQFLRESSLYYEILGAVSIPFRNGLFQGRSGHLHYNLIWN